MQIYTVSESTINEKGTFSNADKWVVEIIRENTYNKLRLSYSHFRLQSWSPVLVTTSGGPQFAAAILQCALCSIYCDMSWYLSTHI